ncbi:MAG: response regulator [Chitinophagales bacterium]|nr:response regulator [Chitinophagales bacterium]
MAQEKTYSIYLVDDDAKHLLLLKEHLVKHLPYSLNVKTFTSGEEVLQQLDSKPDIIILDYYFDGAGAGASDGVDILKKIRNQKPEIPVVMMSHADKIEVAVTCYDYGAKDYIIKNETAYAKALLVVRNIIHELKKEEVAHEYKESSKNAQRLLIAFILVLLVLMTYLLYREFGGAR